MADELIDILDEVGKFTGKIELKSEAHRLGLYHASVHIWFYTNKGEVLLQKRADCKDTYPNLWDVSVAGHIGTGETVESSAIREINEEIGLSVPKDNLNFIGMYLSKKIPKPDLYDNEFHHIYLSHLDVPITSLILQKEEVSDCTLIHINLLEKHLLDPIKSKTYVPHDTAYYDFIHKEIINRL
ncbi:NUDIX hydrolase [Aquimarina longa]|uniref:NUDIX hydrolase n=1 Tax=Aquimarina longa TaxID=1080221 RepID=UPI0007818B97|nr:NUDIX domain-containing protein [Aquimarina longa]